MIYVFLAEGFEEIEALATVDFLRRCYIEVVTVGVGSKEVTGAHNITVQDDTVKVISEDSPYFEITAEDAETKTPVVGAKFVIYSEEGESQFATDSKGNFIGNKELIDNNEYYVVTSDTDGKIILDLPEGMYTAKEIVADEKYDITNSEYKFSVGVGNEEYGEIQKLNIPHERKEFKICTSVAEICGAKGGNISGEDEEAYETVKFGDSSKKEITITPKAIPNRIKGIK